VSASPIVFCRQIGPDSLSRIDRKIEIASKCLQNYHKLLMINNMRKQADKMADKIKITREISRYMSSIGRKGGIRSRRKLDSLTAQNMTRIRDARRIYKKYHAQCFWSFAPNYQIKLEDIGWVAEQLKKNGDRELWKLGTKLCR
jgi:hypothetical protein